MVNLTLDSGELWFEDGTTVSDVSVDLLKAAPKLLKACESLSLSAAEASALQHAGLKVPASVWSNIHQAVCEAYSAITEAQGERK